MPTLRWGSTGADVRALQQRLTELGFFSGAIDGRFGYHTDSAVRRFQRARDLQVDGVVGPETQQALGLSGTWTPSPTSPSTTPSSGSANRAVSLHIGVNRVDPAGYGGWSGPLSGCEADAETMESIARAEGLAVNTLRTAQATSHNVLGSIAQIAGALQAGDFFLLTYAGHGGQMPNDNGGDPEADSMDETWCLYDRQLLDDEIEAALAAFQRGVNVVLLSDSCHSGSVYRMVAAPTFQQVVETERSYASLKAAFYADLAVGRPGPGDQPFESVPRPQSAAPLELVSAGGTRAAGAPGLPVLDLDERADSGTRSGGGSVDGTGVMTRNMPMDALERLWKSQRSMYQQIRQAAASRSPVRANGLSISGCMDNQLSQESGGHGVFTTVLDRVWNSNRYMASYEAFHREIVSNMAPSQTPELGLFGENPQELLAKTPFDR